MWSREEVVIIVVRSLSAASSTLALPPRKGQKNEIKVMSEMMMKRSLIWVEDARWQVYIGAGTD